MRLEGQALSQMILASALGALILLWLKYLLCVFIVLGAALAAVRVFSARRKGLKGSLNAPLCVILMGAAAIAGGHSFSRSSIDQRTLVYHYDETELRQDSIMDNLMLWAPSYSGYRKILGGYYVNSTASRIARLPFTASAQYFPPFPWNFTRDTQIGRFVPWAHLPFWYMVGGLVLAYYIFCAFNRRRRGGMAWWSLWVALCWLGIAYVSAGSVPRYWLPLVPAMIPMGLQVAACVRSGAISRKAISIYSITYLVLLAAALTAANICLYQ